MESSDSAEYFDNLETPKERWRRWYAVYHPHPMTVHFPIALHYFSGFADFLFLLHPSGGYETAVFLSFLIATVMGLVALISGVLSWWVNYSLVRSKVFMIKLYGALFTLLVGFVPIIQRLLDPMVAYDRGAGGMLYHGVIFLTVISVSIVGYYGGKITWRNKK